MAGENVAGEEQQPQQQPPPPNARTFIGNLIGGSHIKMIVIYLIINQLSGLYFKQDETAAATKDGGEGGKGAVTEGLPSPPSSPFSLTPENPEGTVESLRGRFDSTVNKLVSYMKVTETTRLPSELIGDQFIGFMAFEVNVVGDFPISTGNNNNMTEKKLVGQLSSRQTRRLTDADFETLAEVRYVSRIDKARREKAAAARDEANVGVAAAEDSTNAASNSFSVLALAWQHGLRPVYIYGNKMYRRFFGGESIFGEEFDTEEDEMIAIEDRLENIPLGTSSSASVASRQQLITRRNQLKGTISFDGWNLDAVPLSQTAKESTQFSNNAITTNNNNNPLLVGPIPFGLTPITPSDESIVKTKRSDKSDLASFLDNNAFHAKAELNLTECILRNCTLAAEITVRFCNNFRCIEKEEDEYKSATSTSRYPLRTFVLRQPLTVFVEKEEVLLKRLIPASSEVVPEGEEEVTNKASTTVTTDTSIDKKEENDVEQSFWVDTEEEQGSDFGAGGDSGSDEMMASMVGDFGTGGISGFEGDAAATATAVPKNTKAVATKKTAAAPKVTYRIKRINAKKSKLDDTVDQGIELMKERLAALIGLNWTSSSTAANKTLTNNETAEAVEGAVEQEVRDGDKPAITKIVSLLQTSLTLSPVIDGASYDLAGAPAPLIPFLHNFNRYDDKAEKDDDSLRGLHLQPELTPDEITSWNMMASVRRKGQEAHWKSANDIEAAARYELLSVRTMAPYRPVVYVNNFWVLESHLKELPDADTIQKRLVPNASSTASASDLSPQAKENILDRRSRRLGAVQNFTVSIQPLTLMKFMMYTQFDTSMDMHEGWGSMTRRDRDNTKRMFLETNPYFLGLTMCVSMLHMFFEYLAFKNDVTFWRARSKTKDYKGLSLRTVAVNCYFQTVILLYLMDSPESTSYMILIPSFFTLLLEFWKLKGTVKLVKKGATAAAVAEVTDKEGKNDEAATAAARGAAEAREQLGVLVSLFGYKLVFNKSYTNNRTSQYDKQAIGFLMKFVLLPGLVFYSIYSAMYHDHRGWYSFLIQCQVRYIYFAGFIMMTPQIFINYKMKSVARLPWRTFVYKFLNTIIDDLFAFIVTMPTMHRLACFRDDIVFVILLYQRWAYPVDSNRNEQGEEDDDDVEEEKMNDATTTAIKYTKAETTATTTTPAS